MKKKEILEYDDFTSQFFKGEVYKINIENYLKNKVLGDKELENILKKEPKLIVCRVNVNKETEIKGFRIYKQIYPRVQVAIQSILNHRIYKIIDYIKTMEILATSI